jgi:predicted transcriptional regulator
MNNPALASGIIFTQALELPQMNTHSTTTTSLRTSSGAIAPVELQTFDDGPRALDLDIAKRLAFRRPRKIRELIERNRVELERFGSIAPRRGAYRGKAFDEFWLNEEQSLLIAALSETERAAEVRHMLIKVFVAWRRGELKPIKVQPTAMIAVAREGRLQYRMFRSMLRDMGIKGNQAVLSANRATKMTTGFDAMGALGITHIDAAVNEPDLNPTTIASRLGLRTAQEVNKLLSRHEYQTAHRDGKGHIYYELTPKGERAGGVFKDTDKRTGHGVPVKQLMWATRIIDLLRADMASEEA